MGDLHVDDAELCPVELADARPQIDRVRMEQVRARAELALFGSAEPARIGRFVIRGRIADGGMGVVYEAKDPQLGRNVALKVLHPRQHGDDRARQRLIAEAQALARLDHPAVVKVHDVVTHEGQVVIVMELVAGMTLAAWERARPRTWREIVDVYARAGDGLAAAHGVGVVHRDFKPANVVVGDDARVRVLDFGLARFAGAGADEPALATGSPGEPSGTAPDLTATGDVVGTLGFTAPEQLAGEAVTAAADQFSFCVALHRAIEGQPPFTGSDVPQLQASIHAATIAIARDDRRVPRWLRALIARGLREPPTARFPSMAALLAELRRPRGLRRWRTPFAALAAVAVLAGVTLAARRPQADLLAGCDRGAADLEGVWNTAVRTSIAAALDRTRNLRDRVLGELDTYSDRWRTMSSAACIDHRRGFQSDDLLDRRMICLRRRLGDVQAAVRELGRLGAGAADHAIDLVAKLPSIEPCGDAERLRVDQPPPATPEMRAQVDQVRDQLSAATALDHAGRSADARATVAAALVQARASGYPPVVVEAALLDGRILMDGYDLPGAAGPLDEARTLALEHGMTSAAVEAAARLVYAEGNQKPDLAILGHDARVFESLAAGLPPSEHFARPLLLNNIGTVYMALERRDDAETYFQAAHRALAGVADADLDPELTCVDKNLAMVTRDATERERLARTMWEHRRAKLGDGHLETLEALDSYARYTSDPDRALQLITDACRGFDGLHPDDLAWRVPCNDYRALLTEVRGDLAGAAAIYAEIEQAAAGTTDLDSYRQLASGRLSIRGGDLEGARGDLNAVVKRDAASTYWWNRARAFDAEVELAAVEHAAHHDADARRHLEVAIAGYRSIGAINEELEPHLRVAAAALALAALDSPAPP